MWPQGPQSEVQEDGSRRHSRSLKPRAVIRAKATGRVTVGEERAAVPALVTVVTRDPRVRENALALGFAVE